MRSIVLSFIFIFFSLISSVWACESCLIQRMGRDTQTRLTEDGKFFFKYFLEHQDWEEIPVEVAHDLHHDGHHIHLKTRETINHFGFGYQWNERLNTTLDIPFVRRGGVEVHHHARLGNQYFSKGIGDATVTAAYDVWKKSNKKLGVIAGVKLPTGETQEYNDDGERFEPEMQPGTGSDDYVAGFVYQQTFSRWDLTANSMYTLKTEGDQDYEFGDSWSTSVFWDYVPEQERFRSFRPGVVANLRYEAKHKEAGSKISDSGGTTLFLGPEISYLVKGKGKVFANILLPVSQDLGGVHQEVESMSNIGLKMEW